MNYSGLFLLILTGFISGIVLNHLADIFPARRRILLKPICRKCGQTFDYLNYILFKPCQECGAKPSLRKYLVPFLSAISVTFVWNFPPAYTGRGLALVIFFYLALIFIIDVEHRLILFPLSIVGGVLFAIMGVILNGLLDTLIGGAAGFGIMYALYLLGILFSKWMSKRRGEEIEEVALGFGDVTLSLIIGLLVGWPRISLVILFAIILGGVFSALFIAGTFLLKRYRSFTAIPYAPFIIIATVIIIYVSSHPVL